MNNTIDAYKMINAEFNRYIATCLFSSVWDSAEARHRIESVKHHILCNMLPEANQEIETVSNILGNQTAQRN